MARKQSHTSVTFGIQRPNNLIVFVGGKHKHAAWDVFFSQDLLKTNYEINNDSFITFGHYKAHCACALELAVMEATSGTNRRIWLKFCKIKVLPVNHNRCHILAALTYTCVLRILKISVICEDVSEKMI